VNSAGPSARGAASGSSARNAKRGGRAPPTSPATRSKSAGVGAGGREERHVRVRDRQRPAAQLAEPRDGPRGGLAPKGGRGAEAQAALDAPLGARGHGGGEDGVARALRVGRAGVEARDAILERKAQREGRDDGARGRDGERELDPLGEGAREGRLDAGLVGRRVGDGLHGHAPRLDRDARAGQLAQGLDGEGERGLPALGRRVGGRAQEVRDLLAPPRPGRPRPPAGPRPRAGARSGSRPRRCAGSRRRRTAARPRPSRPRACCR
jgi:hypothetical protein